VIAPLPPQQKQVMRPFNYRTNDFHLQGKDIAIGGMAGPHSNKDVNAALRYLRDTEKRTVLIGLHDHFDFKEDAERNGLEYYHIPVPDFSSKPISPATYDAIYAAVKKAATIHCGAGDGRTGTALASIKLRELLEQAARVNPSILDENPANTTLVHAKMAFKNIPCTPLVKQAVEGIRTNRKAIDSSGSHSVETENDIQTLINYEKHLRQVIKQELKATQAMHAGASVPEAVPAQPAVQALASQKPENTSVVSPEPAAVPAQPVAQAAATTAVETKAVSIPAEQVAVFWTDTLASKVSDAIQNTEADSGKKNINSELRKAQNDKNAIKAEELLNQLLLGKLQRAIGFTTAKKGTKPEMQRLNEELIDARKNNDFVRAEQLINQLQNLDHQFKK